MKRNWFSVAVLAMGAMLTVALAEGENNAVPAGAQDNEKGAGGRGEGEKPRLGGMRDLKGGEQGRRPMGGGMSIIDIQQAIMLRILNNPEVSDQLGLTEEQRASIKASMEQLNEEQKKIAAELESSGMEQVKLLTADPVDETALMAAVDRSNKIRGEMAKLVMKRVLIVKKTLTTEQIQKIKDMVQERRKTFEERRMGDRPGGGGDRPRGEGRGGGQKQEKGNRGAEAPAGAML